jgi:hypothetical protein
LFTDLAFHHRLSVAPAEPDGRDKGVDETQPEPVTR